MSSPSYRLVFSSEAEDDVEGILRHSLMQWGEVQERRYAEALDRAFLLLADNPNLGRRRDELQPGYRSYLVRQHLIIYRVRGDAVIIVRVLHSRMDIASALQEDS